MKLSCAETERRLRALIDGELDPGESRRVLAHLERCARCRERDAAIRRVASLVQALEPEEVPPHFTANLQVRLASHRAQRARRAGWLPAWGWRRFGLRAPRRPAPRWRWAGGLAVAGVGMLLAATALPRMSAAEVAQRAERSWQQVRNYGCVFESTGVYQGQPRTFRQQQFFRRPGEFRFDTTQDYPLTTYVYEDRVIHYLPGGEWKRRGPLVIIRPRLHGQNALPFPFGVTWLSGGNISVERLIRQLRENQPQLLGTESVGARSCYRLRFTVASGPQMGRYDIWLDMQDFLPRRVTWFRDAENQIDTVARDLQVNSDVLPAGTFDFQTPEGAFVVRGDVDPHVLALPAQRTEAFARDPLVAANREAWERASAVPFPVLVPGWLPAGYELVRVRRKEGRWVDMHWLRERGSGGDVLKLVEQEVRIEPEIVQPGEPLRLRVGGKPVVGRLLVREQPYPYALLAWRQGPTHCLLSGAGLSVGEMRRIAESLERVRPPQPEAVAVRRQLRAGAFSGPSEPSVLPGAPPGGLPAGAPGVSVVTLPSGLPPVPMMPMMPEISDEDQAGGVPRMPVLIQGR